MPVEANPLRCAYVVIAACVVVASDYALGKKDCEFSRLEQCMKEMQHIMQNQRMIFATSEEDLNAVCLTFYGKIECIDDFISTCFTTEKKEMYDRMRQGSMGVIDDLCNDGKFRNEYLQHASCFSNSSNYHQCMDSFKQLLKESVYWAGNDNLGVDKSLVSYCCATSRYEACTYDMVLQHCGHETVAFYQHFINRSSSAFKGRCVNYTAESVWCSGANILNVRNCALLQLLLVVAVEMKLFGSP